MSTGNGQETGETTVTYDEAIEAGYWGTHPDPAGNEPYTLEGVSGGGEEPPPETSKSSGGGSSSGSSSSGSSSGKSKSD